MSSPTRSPITTHVLDQMRGKAAAGIHVRLERSKGAPGHDQWQVIKESVTNKDGRIEDLMTPGSRAEAGIYRMSFETAEYFRALSSPCFYPTVTITFEITQPQEHHHVPLLLSPFGYSTYRGT